MEDCVLVGTSRSCVLFHEICVPRRLQRPQLDPSTCYLLPEMPSWSIWDAGCGRVGGCGARVSGRCGEMVLRFEIIMNLINLLF